LAFNVPPGVPWWMVVVGSFIAIAIAKQVFGGLGFNPMNPALVGRAFLMASWPVAMTTAWLAPRGGTLSGAVGLDVLTSATPLNVLKLSRKIILDPLGAPDKIAQAKQAVAAVYHAWPNMMWGNIGGVIGETSAIAILIGGLYLIIRGFADWRIPTAYIGAVAFFGWIFGGVSGLFTGNVLFQIFGGGVFLGAFFMATDMVTSPITKPGRWIFGLGGGFIAVIIRRWGGYPEGVCYSILLMNLLVPIIDRYTMPKIFGAVKKGGESK
jgi:electron transport complex protein RnfD